MHSSLQFAIGAFALSPFIAAAVFIGGRRLSRTRLQQRQSRLRGVVATFVDKACSGTIESEDVSRFLSVSDTCLDGKTSPAVQRQLARLRDNGSRIIQLQALACRSDPGSSTRDVIGESWALAIQGLEQSVAELDLLLAGELGAPAVRVTERRRCFASLRI